MAGQTVLFHQLLHAAEQLAADSLDVIVKAGLKSHLYTGVCRVNSHLISAVGAADADYTSGAADIHDFCLAADQRYGCAAGQSLCKGRYIRLHAVVSRSAAGTEAQAGYYLVHYHADAFGVAQLAYAVNKLLLHQGTAHVEAYRLQYNGGNIALVLLDKLLNGFEII